MLSKAARSPLMKRSGVFLLMIGLFAVGLIAVVLPGPGPVLAADATSQGLAFVVNRGEPFAGLPSTVAVVDTDTQTILQEIEVGSMPTSLALARNTQLLYVTNTGDNSISVISTRDLSVVDVIPTGGGPWGIAITPDGHTAYVTHVVDATVGVLRLDDNAFVDTITSSFFDTPQGVAITPNGHFAYVANVAFRLGSSAENVTVLQTSDNTVRGAVDVSSYVNAFGPWDVTILPDGQKGYTNDGDDGEFVFEFDTNPQSPSFNQVTDVIAIGQPDDGINGPRGMESGATPMGVRVYVALSESGEVVVIDPHTNEIEARVSTGPFFPWRLRLNRSGTQLYVSLRESNEVLVLDTRTNREINRIAGFVRPADIAFR
jgi:YVTN family beta-propeller protein